MPLHICWDNEEKTAIRCESEGNWTWDEYHTSLEQIAEMMREVNHHVDLINIRRLGATMPRGSSLPHFQRALAILPDNFGLNIFVTNNAVARVIVSVFTRVYASLSGGRLLMVGTLEEARAVVAKERAKRVTP
jgi:hypothetical protein